MKRIIPNKKRKKTSKNIQKIKKGKHRKHNERDKEKIWKDKWYRKKEILNIKQQTIQQNNYLLKIFRGKKTTFQINMEKKFIEK